MRFLIYALEDLNTRERFYVGSSERGMDRPRSHLRKSGIALIRKGHRNEALANRIEKLNGAVGILVLQTFETAAALWAPNSDGLCAEAFWIRLLRDRGSPLLNISKGGRAPGAGRKQSPEHIAARIAARQKSGKWSRVGHKNTPEAIDNMKRAQRARAAILTPEEKSAAGRRMAGTRALALENLRKPETRAKLRAASVRRGRTVDGKFI